MSNLEQNLNDFLFERNEPKQDILDNIPKTVEELLKQYSEPETATVARKLLHVIFEINGDGTINKMRDSFQRMGEDDLYIFDAIEDVVYINQIPFDDILLLGKIKGKFLRINILPLIMIEMDLSKIIKTAIQNRQPSIIYKMMNKNIDIFQIEPRIMCMAEQMDLDDLLIEMVNCGISISTEDYRCVYQLAEKGKLEILKKIMAKYTFPDITEIVCKICMKSATNNQPPILQHFLAPDAFAGAPDQMLEFLLNSIQYGGHLEVVKFFVDNGVNIRRNNYEPVKQAIKYNRHQLVQYFCQIDESVISLLTDEQKDKCGLVKIIMMDQDIGLDKMCNICDDEILENNTYFQCTAKLHYYKQDAWKEFQKYKTDWVCPLCHTDVKRILYVNKKPNF